MNADIFLNEPIKKVFTLQYTEKYEKAWHDAYLSIRGAFEYHVTDGYWLLFETENYFATIGHDGLRKYKKPYEFSEEKFVLWYNGDEEWIPYEETIFAGQKIHFIELQNDYQVIYFDDFQLNLYVYGEGNFNVKSIQFGDGINVMTVGGHLLKKCPCGGTGELLYDERSDFAVRCSVCHKATYFDAILKEQIEKWNEDKTPCVIHTGLETLKELLATQKVKYIALSSSLHDFDVVDKTTCYCSHAIIGFENAFFNLTSQKYAGNIFDFAGEVFSDYNRNFWSNVITPTDSILFVSDKDYQNRKILWFKLDNTDLFIEARGYGLVFWFKKEHNFTPSET